MVPIPLRFGSIALGLSVFWAALTITRTALADARFDRIVSQLRNNEDFRVRTQAALALGASKTKDAVEPLCTGLDDPNTSVRAAAAAALGKLRLGGDSCLADHVRSETSSAVKAVLLKSIAGVKAVRAPTVTSATKYYVAIGPTTDKTGRAGAEVDDLVHQAIADAASELDGCVVAPRDEKVEAAKRLVAKFKKLKTYFLWPKVARPDYSGGKLTMRFEVAVFTYPGKALKGTIPLKLTMPDVSATDTDSEDDLIKRAASSAFERFADNADRFAE